MRILKALGLVLATALAVALLLAAVWPPVASTPRPPDTVVNGDFERGSLEPWTLTPGAEASADD